MDFQVLDLDTPLRTPTGEAVPASALQIHTMTTALLPLPDRHLSRMITTTTATLFQASATDDQPASTAAVLTLQRVPFVAVPDSAAWDELLATASPGFSPSIHALVQTILGENRGASMPELVDGLPLAPGDLFVIRQLSVLPAWRNQGLGPKFLAMVLRALTSGGRDVVMVCTHDPHGIERAPQIARMFRYLGFLEGEERGRNEGADAADHPMFLRLGIDPLSVRGLGQFGLDDHNEGVRHLELVS